MVRDVCWEWISEPPVVRDVYEKHPVVGDVRFGRKMAVASQMALAVGQYFWQEISAFGGFS